MGSAISSIGSALFGGDGGSLISFGDSKTTGGTDTRGILNDRDAEKKAAKRAKRAMEVSRRGAGFGYTDYTGGVALIGGKGPSLIGG